MESCGQEFEFNPTEEWRREFHNEEDDSETSNEIIWFDETCHPKRSFTLNTVYEQVDPNLPTEPRRQVMGYELGIAVEEVWPKIMHGECVRFTPTLHDQYLEKADTDIGNEVVRIIKEYMEDDVLKFQLVITMSSYIGPWDPYEGILPRRSAEDRKVFGTRVKEQVESLQNCGLHVGRVSVYVGIDKHSFKVAQDVNQDWHMVVRCGQK